MERSCLWSRWWRQSLLEQVVRQSCLETDIFVVQHQSHRVCHKCLRHTFITPFDCCCDERVPELHAHGKQLLMLSACIYCCAQLREVGWCVQRMTRLAAPHLRSLSPSPSTTPSQTRSATAHAFGRLQLLSFVFRKISSDPQGECNLIMEVGPCSSLWCSSHVFLCSSDLHGMQSHHEHNAICSSPSHVEVLPA